MPAGYLGLDLAAAWGWAMFDGDGRYVASGHRRWTLHHSLAVRCIQLRDRIADLVTQYDPAVIAIEKPINAGRNSSYYTLRALMSYATAAEEIAYHRELAFHEFGRSTCCKAALGNGHAKKPEGVAFAMQFKAELISDDEADAVLVAITAHAKLTEARAA